MKSFPSFHRPSRTNACLILALFCSPFLKTSAQAQTAAPPYQIESVVVTATRVATPLSAVAASVSVLNQAQVQDTAAQELDDVLQSVPGVDLLGYSADSQHPTSDSFSMRGLGGGAQGISRALVMVDGVPINDPFFGYVQWNRAPLDDIDRVEIVRGGGSPLWGNYAEGGVINIITRAADQNELSLDAGAGSYGTYRDDLSGAYRLEGGNVLQLFFGVNGTAGYQQVPVYERAPFNVPTSLGAANLHLKDTLTARDGLTGHWSLDLHDNHQRLETVLDSNDQQNLNLTGDVAKTFSAGSTLAFTGFYGHSIFQTDNSTYFPDEFDLAATTQSLNEIHRVVTDDVGASLVWSGKSAGVLRDWLTGADCHYIAGEDHTQHFIAPDFSPTFFATHGGGDQLYTGWFLHGTVAPVERLQIAVSGRLQEVQNTDGFDGSLGGLGGVPNTAYTRFDPRLNVRYALTGGFALRGAAYDSFRAPNLGDQFYTYAAGGFVQLPSPGLKPENLQGGEIGLDFVRPGFRSQLTLYRSSIDNYIVIEPATNAVYTPNGWYVVQNQNIAAVRAQGIEEETSWEMGGGFTAGFAATLADSVVTANPIDPMSVGQQLIDVPRTRLGGSLAYADPRGWRVRAQLEYVSRTDWASPDHTDPGYPGKISADAHALVSLTGSYPLAHNVEAYVQVQNLLNRRYIATSYSAPSAQAFGTPFELFGGLRLKFE